MLLNIREDSIYLWFKEWSNLKSIIEHFCKLIPIRA